jgi:zinc D-Ala-D-Ala carboxypeptidase
MSSLSKTPKSLQVQRMQLFDKYFKYEEFDSPDSEESGKENMDKDFLVKLADARDIARVPFRITSGYRTEEYHKNLTKRGYKTAVNSSHTKGKAADISVGSPRKRWIIVNALLLAGFNRIGIGESFIHVDSDEEKVPDLIWTYDY